MIGRSATWVTAQLKALHGLNCRLAGLSVMTYDQLQAEGERLVQMLSAREAAETEDSADLQTVADEDFPF